MTATNDTIMKADRRGRLRYGPEQRETLVAAYEASGLSGPRFAALHGVNYQTLAGWLQKRRGATRTPRLPAPGEATGAMPLFIKAEWDGGGLAGQGGALELVLPGGARLLVRAAGQVALAAALVRELNAMRPC